MEGFAFAMEGEGNEGCGAMGILSLSSIISMS